MIILDSFIRKKNNLIILLDCIVWYYISCH